MTWALALTGAIVFDVLFTIAVILLARRIKRHREEQTYDPYE